jgi:cell division protease FtsH
MSDDCYAEARPLLREHRDKLDAIVVRLLERETLDEPEIYAAAGIPLPTAEQPAPAPQASGTPAGRREDPARRQAAGASSWTGLS